MARSVLILGFFLSLGLGLEAKICPPNFSQVDLKCVYVSVEKENWFDADRKCKSLGAELLVVDDDYDKVSLTNHLTKNHHISERYWDSMWVGINCVNSGREFVNSKDVDAIPYLPWLRQEPNNNGGNENCVSFANYGGDWGSGYLDIRCSFQLQYMCQIQELNNENDMYFTGTTESLLTIAFNLLD